MAVSRTLCVCGCETEGRRCTHTHTYIRVYTVDVCVYVNEEPEKKKGRRSAVAVTESGVRGWEFLTVDDSTASCGVFQHLNNFPLPIRFPLALFRFFHLKK